VNGGFVLGHNILVCCQHYSLGLSKWFIVYRRSVLSDLFSDPQESHVYDNEIATEDLYKLLEQQNERINQGGTIRLPSDFLHRRKSR